MPSLSYRIVHLTALSRRTGLACAAVVCLFAAGCGGGGGGGGGGGTVPSVTLGAITLTGSIDHPSTALSVTVDGTPAVVTGTTWSFSSAQSAPTHTYHVELFDGVDLIAQRDVQVSR